MCPGQTLRRVTGVSAGEHGPKAEHEHRHPTVSHCRRRRRARRPASAPAQHPLAGGQTVDDWSQGAPLAWIQDICRYWAETYDWRAREAASTALRSSPPRSTGSTSISFTRARRMPDAMPLLITHGWPGSIVEFHKVIEPLTDPTALRRQCGRCVSCRLPVAAGLRLLGQADRHRLGRRSHRAGLDGADGAARLRALRRAGRRLGIGRDHRHRRAGPRTLRRHSHHARDGRAPAGRGRTHGRGSAGAAAG